MNDAPTPGVGHNAPPPLPTPEAIATTLAEQYPKIVARAAEIEEKLAKVPEVISTQDESDRASEFVRACMTFEKHADAAREEEKAPWLAGERAVDGFFNRMRTTVKNIKIKLELRTTAYDVKNMKAEEDRRKEEARKLQEEAEILEAKAKAARSNEQEEKRGAAAAATQMAQDAAAAVNVKPAELTRTRTGSGVTRSLRVTWKHEVTEPKKVPKKYLAPSADLIDGAIKAATTEDNKCTLEIPGVRIYPDYHSQVR